MSLPELRKKCKVLHLMVVPHFPLACVNAERESCSLEQTQLQLMIIWGRASPLSGVEPKDSGCWSSSSEPAAILQEC
jgi:hypothetical protein